MFRGDGSSGELNGFLDAGSHIQGDLHFEDTFRVDGKVSGKVHSKGDLVVGEGGVVEGEISAGRVFVSGTVRGKMQADQRVEICAGGKVFAEVSTTALVIEDGAIFEGQCSMGAKGEGGASPTKAPRTERPPVKEAK